MGSLRLYLLLSLLLITFHQTRSQQLPTNWKPKHYTILLTPDFNNSTFSGRITIYLELLDRTSYLVLNCIDLQILPEATRLLKDNQVVFKQPQHYYNHGKQILVISSSNLLEPGIYTLNLAYVGHLQNNTEWLVWNFYYENNEPRYLAATHFDPTYARATFPCFDEPGFKATFEITIKHSENYKVFSNMPIKMKTERDITGAIWSTFETTPPMSTYNVAFAISDFERIKSQNGNFSIWCRQQSLNSMVYALQIGKQVISVLEEFTGIAYELPKLDIFCVPNKQYVGSNNWGLIMISEKELSQNIFYSHVGKFGTITTIVHAIAHQWFGNLVTQAWWNDFWIIEGLVIYLSYYFTSQVIAFPKYNEYFVSYVTFHSLKIDMHYYNVPVGGNIRNPEEVKHLFYSKNIHYKAAAVMHMLKSLISGKVFRAGIQKLLQKYQHRAVTSDDFWQTMQETMEEHKLPFAPFDLKSRIGPYISQKGYPLVFVSRNYKTGDVKLTQRCFGCDPNMENRKWWIPINFATGLAPIFSSTFATHWMDPNKKELVIKGIHPADWIIINIQGSGYYRVIYDEKSGNRLSNYLDRGNYGIIDPLNRAKLIYDALWVAQYLHGLNLTYPPRMGIYGVREKERIVELAIYEFLNYFESDNE